MANNHYPLLSNELIPLAFHTLDEVEILAKRLIDIGYKDLDDLANCKKHKYPPIAIIIEPPKKLFRDGPNRTIMACMCQSRKRKPLYVNELLNHFDKIITNFDIVFYNRLLLEITNDKTRDMPTILTLEEAERIKNNPSLAKLVEMVKNAKKEDEQ